MASRDLFNIAHSPVVYPIPCTDCGHNMHCVRRSATPQGECQQFSCATCGATHERTLAEQVSDSDIQREAERLSGVPQQAAFGERKAG